MAAIPTVKIKAGGAFRIINAEDFDPEIHCLYEPKPEVASQKVIERPSGFLGHYMSDGVTKPTIRFSPIKRGQLKPPEQQEDANVSANK